MIDSNENNENRKEGGNQSYGNIIKVGFFEKGRKALNIEKIEKIKEITGCLMEIPSQVE